MVASSLAATTVSSGDPPGDHPQGESHLVLEITRGHTRFPLRPVRGPRFLIGAAVTCDLRLGGHGMPALHSLISLDDDGYTLEAIASDPPLLINRELVQIADLHDGDIIIIGEVEMTVRLVASQSPACGTSPLPHTAKEFDDRPLADHSAAELIEHIELEQEALERVELGRRAGADTLMAEIRRRQRTAPEVTRIDAGEPQTRGPHFVPKADPARLGKIPTTSEVGPIDPSQTDDLGQLAQQLTELSEELRLSLEGANERETQYAQSLELLLMMQQRLAQQLAEVTDSVDRLRSQQERPQFEASRPRAIA